MLQHFCQEVQDGSSLSPQILELNVHAVFERYTLKFARVFIVPLRSLLRMTFVKRSAGAH